MNAAIESENRLPLALSEAEFCELMDQFEPFGEDFAVAVSGGPDSMALAFCMKRWTTRQNHGVLKAFIVDHALRESSAYEADETCRRLLAIGLYAEVVRWEHDPIQTALHISARKARYELLLSACKRHEISTLLFAHQREDQAETVLMRLAKGSGIDGLAGISAEFLKQGVRILRPLLKIEKVRLQATCDEAQIPYFIDPSNMSEQFARGRLRRVLPLLAKEGFTIERLLDLSERAKCASVALKYYTNIFLRTFTTLDRFGVVKIDLDKFCDLPTAIAERVVIRCLNVICPTEYPPERAALLSLMSSISSDHMTPRTLHGCHVSLKTDQIVFIREYSAINQKLEVQGLMTILWDGRWMVDVKNVVKGHILCPLGNPPHEILDSLAPTLRQNLPEGRARACLPSLWNNGILVAIPSFDGESDATIMSARLREGELTP